MNVGELIDHLSKFPKDAVVLTSFCSDVEEVDEEQVTLHDQGTKRKFHKRNDGRYYTYFEPWWDKAEGTPQIVQAVYFRGN